MLEDYEQRVAIGYVHALARAARGDGRTKRFVVEWAADAGPSVGIHAALGALGARGERREREEPVTDEAFDRVRTMIETRAKALRRARPGGLERNIRKLAGLLDLDPLETELLGALVRLKTVEPACAIYDWWEEHARRPRLALWTRLLGHMLAVPRREIALRLAPRGRLLASGLFSIHYDGDIDILSEFLRAFEVSGQSEADIADLLLGAPAEAALAWEDFEHMAEEAEHVLRLLAGALERREAGVHVLLYGPPGTGKTEFCRTLAARLGAPLYPVGEASEEGHEMSRPLRLAALRFAQKLIPGRGRALLLFDEMEDLFGEQEPERSPHYISSGRKGSIVYLHRLLETAPVPTLWTVNSLDAIGPAVIRRMTCALAFDTPPPRARARVWRRELMRHGFTIAEPEVADLVRRFETPPALAATAVRTARLSGGGLAEMRRAVAGIARALGQEVPPERASQAAFAPDLANADLDLGEVVERLARPGAPQAVSLCLYGPPGTGKSLFVRHLAEAMGMEVLERRASDILSMWLGGSEKNIARAFAEARRQRAFLVFDEADSLLATRRDAVRSWEVSQVNEMLTWMESHELPFACTTNLVERLDEAALRRFTLRIALAPLTREQARRAFRRFFHAEPPPTLDALDLLTPGDFAVVARRAALLGRAEDPRALLSMLKGEQAAKPGATRPVGFALHAHVTREDVG